MKTKQIKVELPKGGTLDVEYTEKFIEAVCKWGRLASADEVTDTHIRTYIYGAMKNAIDNQESL
jgi:hypothetical protein